LCELLRTSGVAGRPEEFFTPDFRKPWFEQWGLPGDASFADYLAASRRYATGRNGVFGFKIQYMHVQVLAREVSFVGASDDVLEHLFPGSRFINLIRRDRRAQALSWFRAINTNEWFRTARTPQSQIPEAPAELDPVTVLMLERHLADQQAGWERYFKRRGIEPLRVEYEGLCADYRHEIRRVLSFLGLDEAAARWMPAPSLVRQSDDVTLRWRKQMEGVARSSPAGA
jgi:LPS sulfotransferase NodH